MAQGGTEETFDCMHAKVIQLLSTLDWRTDVNVSDLHELHSLLLIMYDKYAEQYCMSGVMQ